MDSKGADLFPVASGVQIPFVCKEIILDSTLRKNVQDASDVFTVQETRNQPDTTFVQKQYKFYKSVGAVNSQSSLATGEDALKKIQELSQKQLGILKDKSKRKVNKRYLKTISDGLVFSDEVVGDRGKYNESLSSHLKSMGIYGARKDRVGSKKLNGRHDARCPVVRHYPCLQGKQDNLTIRFKDKKTKPLPSIKTSSKNDLDIFVDQKETKALKNTPKRALSWDEYVMGLLSRETAEMVVKEHTSGLQSSKLNNLLSKKYDKGTNTVSIDTPTRISDSINENLPNNNENKAVVKDDKDISKRKDVVYLKEIVHGALPVNTKSHKEHEIVLDSDMKRVFGKVLEESYPSEVVHWYDWEAKESDDQSKKENKKKMKKFKRGLQKWKDYPEILEDSEIHKMTLSNVTPAQSVDELDPKAVKKQREDPNLVRLVDEWRGKWFLERKWEDSSSEELLRGMNDINDHVRLSAVSACSKAMLNRKIRDAKSKERTLLLQKEKQEQSFEDVLFLTPELIQKITELQSDKCKQVQVASAITLFALNRANQKAKDLLLDVLHDGGPPEKWAAAQCLAYAECDSDSVIQELISHVNSPDIVKHSKSVKLLAKLSKLSTNVLYMMAEQLNSSSWRDRVVACQVFPSLQGPLTKDVANKISHLMWTDWSKDVRTAAARALGKTGNGKLVHDKLRERLMHGNEIEIIDALRKISLLGIMTGRLLPSFINCLKSDYVSIRLEAVKTVAAIHLGQDEIVHELVRLTNEERNWKVKAHCIKAIGLVAKPTEIVQEVLLWCLRYEREAAIRAEACRAISNLELNSDEIISILQDRIVVEEDPMVKSEVASTLNSFGLIPTGDLTMTEAIQKEVKRLCNRDNIANAIFNQDMKDKYAENHRKYLQVEEESMNTKDAEPSSKSSHSVAQLMINNTQRGFDPILEGYRIRSNSQVTVPEFPYIESPVLEYQAESDGEGFAGQTSEGSPSGGNEIDENQERQTICSRSTGTYLFD